VVHSGHGLQAYWLFNEPWYFENEDEHRRASALVEGWQSWFRGNAGKRGWHVDSTHDLARVFRIPGTYNCKVDPILVRVIKQSHVRYESSDFEDYAVTHDEHPSDRPEKDKGSEDFRLDPSIYDTTKYLIIHGDTLGKYPSRSEAVYGVVSVLIRCGYSDDAIISILTNPSHGISSLPIEKGVRWLLSETERARRKNSRKDDEVIPENIPDSLTDMLQKDKKGGIRETFFNISIILQHHPEWIGRLSFDEFRNDVMLDRKVVTDSMESRIAESLGERFGFSGNNGSIINRGIRAASIVHTYDSLKEWIHALPEWDGTERLHSWMIDWCGAEETELTKWISYVTIMQMVARAQTPGCMARFVPVFEGPENRGKTRCIKILGDPWSMTFDMSMDSKEAHMAMAGCWVAELCELDTLRKTTETRLKSFISQQDDTYVPKYSNNRVSHPRRTVFFGTTNEDNYLPSEKGNTRWLPVKTEWFKLDRIEAERDQLFAEAVSLFQSTPDIQWWEELDDIKEQLASARDDRRLINVYEDDLMAWLNGDRETKKRDDVTWSEIASEFLGIEKKDWKDKSLQMQITQPLKAHGWYRGWANWKDHLGQWHSKRAWRRPNTDVTPGEAPF
jgi:predicted P-loop ATPase